MIFIYISPPKRIRVMIVRTSFNGFLSRCVCTPITRKAAKLREFKVFSHCTPTVLRVVAEISHGKDSVFFQLIPKELEFDP